MRVLALTATLAGSYTGFAAGSFDGANVAVPRQVTNARLPQSLLHRPSGYHQDRSCHFSYTVCGILFDGYGIEFADDSGNQHFADGEIYADDGASIVGEFGVNVDGIILISFDLQGTTKVTVATSSYTVCGNFFEGFGIEFADDSGKQRFADGEIYADDGASIVGEFGVNVDGIILTSFDLQGITKVAVAGGILFDGYGIEFADDSGK